MKVWNYKSPGDISLEERKAEDVAADCVKLKILAFGASVLDALHYKGEALCHYPIVPCRQCVGFVSEAGSEVTNSKRGDRVVVYPTSPCGVCSACQEGRPNECDNLSFFGTDADGFARDFATVRASSLYTLPDKVDTFDALFIEHIATAIHTCSKMQLQKGEHIVIVGATIIGLILAQVAMYNQAIPILLDYREDKLELAASLGVALTVNTSESDAGKKIFAITGGHMAETVAYMLASDMPVKNLSDFAARSSRIAFVGNCVKDADINLRPFILKNAKLISVGSSGKNFPAAINMLVNKSVTVSPLISHTVAFDEFGETLKDLAENGEKYNKLIVKL